eukprot:scaffold455_cov116-Isochrysis_galbana.AAC.6
MLNELQGVAPGVSARDMIQERMRVSATAEEWVDAQSGAVDADVYGSEGAGKREVSGHGLDGAGSPLQRRPPAGSAVAAVPFVSRTGSKMWSATKPTGSGGVGTSIRGGSRSQTGGAEGSTPSCTNGAAGRGSSGRLRRDAPLGQASGASSSAQPRPSASLPHCGSAGSFRTTALPLCKALQSHAAAEGDILWSGQTVGTSTGVGVLLRPCSASSCASGASGVQASRPLLSASGGAPVLGISERELADRRMASELAGSRRVLSPSSRWHSRSSNHPAAEATQRDARRP